MKQDLHQLSLSPEEDQIDIPDVDGDFKPNFAEFPSHVTLRHENVRYWKWRKKNPDARPLHPGYPDPDIVRKKDIFQLRDFMAADQRALTVSNYTLSHFLLSCISYYIMHQSDHCSCSMIGKSYCDRFHAVFLSCLYTSCPHNSKTVTLFDFRFDGQILHGVHMDSSRFDEI